MKKFILMTALAAGFLTSCSEDDLGMLSAVDSNSIAFATKQSTPMTRSGETITSINKFTVSAVNEDNSSFFANEEFAYNAGSGVFQSQTPHYWPTTGTLSFYAISNIGSYTVDTNNVPKYTFSNWAAEKDLVAATVKAGEKEIPYPLTFRHLTSQIVVSAEAENKTEELTYKLISVKLTAPSTGTYNFASATGGVGTWTIDNTKTSEYSYDVALPMSFRQNGQIELSSTYWNILPVTDGKLYFAIEYQVLQNGKIIANHTGSKYKECTVSSPGLLSGKIYRYNFILPRSTDDEITFSVGINDWEDGAATNYTPTDQVKDPLKYIYSTTNKTAGVTYDTEKYTGDINIPATTEKDGVVYNVTYIGSDAFKNCTEVTSVTIPESVRYIDKRAFQGCTGLVSMVLPNSIYSIGDYAYKDCIGLSTMEIPSAVKKLNVSVFEGCTSLTAVSLPTSLTYIYESAFSGCTALTSISIPGSVTGVGVNAFQGCTSLPVIDNVRYADTYLVCSAKSDIESCSIKEGTRFIGNNAFYHCSSLKSITIPESVEYIYTDAFQGCSGLASISIPSSVKGIGTRAFVYCSNITSLTISDGVTAIGEGAFKGCSSITSLELPNSVLSICAAAFKDCTNLTYARIGNSVTDIASLVFDGCSKLNNVSITATYPPYIGSMVFPSTITGVYVPYDSLDQYMSQWTEYTTILNGY